MQAQVAEAGEHLQAAGLHRRQVFATGDEAHVLAGCRQPRPEVAADPAGADDDHPHAPPSPKFKDFTSKRRLARAAGFS